MSETYNALILTTPADFERLRDNYARMVRNLAPRRVLFIGNAKVNELIQQSDVREQVGFLDEEELIPFADVHRIMMDVLQVRELPRGVTGWYYQQFLKMQYAFACEDEYYLAWDGDTVPCKPFSMFQKDGFPCLDLKREYHEEYFNTIQILFPGMHKSIEKSFISEHMLMRCDIMRNLIQDIMANDNLAGDTFYERIIRAVRPGQLLNTAFSEFETYGTYVSFRYTYVYHLRSWHSFRLAGEFFHPERMTDEDYAWLAKDFDAISFEKGHFVREDHEEIFTNPRYREKFSARQILEMAQQEFREGYLEVWDEDDATAAILEASKYEASGDRGGMFRAIQKGLQSACDNYELYYMLGYYYLQDNIDQAYLCFQNALYYCQDEEDYATILADMEKLEQSGGVSVRNVAIVIVSYNSCYLMQRNIESIRQTLPDGMYRIVVVDNASEDGVTDWLREQGDVLLVRNEHNAGFAPACNQGVAALREAYGSDYDIYLLNNDTRLTANSLFWLRMGLYESEGTGAAGSCSNYAGNHQQMDVEFTLPQEYLDFGANINVPLSNPYEERVRLSGFSMLIKKQVWDATGGMDEEFAPGYFEDDDLSMKILRAGYRLLFCKNSFIYHAGSQSFAKHPRVENILLAHHQLFIRKYGFDILKYAEPNREVLSSIPFGAEDAFHVLQLGSGLGADLKCIRTLFPNAQAVGVEPDNALYAISAGTDRVFQSLGALAGVITQPFFHVLLISEEEYEGLEAADIELLNKVCQLDCVILAYIPEDTHVQESIPVRDNTSIDPGRIKLVIWDLDNTFWEGVLSEGEVRPVEDNIALVGSLADCGIVNSVSSKNDEAQAMSVLRDWGVDQYFVFADVNWRNKGEQIKKKLDDMHLRAENVLFLDDDVRNLEEAKFYNPGIMVGGPDKIPELTRYVAGLDRTDLAHTRLDSYKILERRRYAQREFSTREQFLFHSDISLEVCRDCQNVLDRIAELVSRTNQLNFTKVRDDKERLMELVADESIDKGYIRVRDRFGDYGIVGFFCYEPGNLRIRHFLFSCRVIGMGIEQCVYNLLQAPDIAVENPVAGRLDRDAATPWIQVCTPVLNSGPGTGQGGSPGKKAEANKIRILLKGPCDMDSIAAYLIGGDVDTEFNFVNEKGFITTGQNHSMHIWESAILPGDQLLEIVRDVPFITMDDFRTGLFSREYHVICYSLLPDCHAGLYRNRATGNYISFGSRNFDLTARENWRGYIDGSIVNHAFPFTEDILRKFAEEWEFVGSTPEQDIIRNLDFIYSHVPGDPMILLLLGSEIEYEGVNEEFANHAAIHRAVNEAVRSYAAGMDRIKIIEMTDYIRSQEDYEDCINHFSRNVYYDLATAVCACINEKVQRLKSKNAR